MEDLEEKKKREEEIKAERERKSDRMDALKEAKTPWFCPECKKVMKKRLDNKMWYLYTHCFDCQVEAENKMRLEGTYDEWVEKKVIANKLAWIEEQKISIEEFKKQQEPEFYNQVAADGHTLDKEKWQTNIKQLKEQADEALEHLQKIEDSLI